MKESACSVWIIVLLSTIGHIKADCVTDLQACDRIISDKYGLGNMELSQIENLNRTELNRRCADVKLFNTCIRKALPSCPITNQLILEGNVQGLEYYCGDGAELGLKYSTCIPQVSVRTGASTCTNTYQRATQSIQPGDIYSFCRLTITYLDCLKQGEKAICGEGASNFMDYLRKLSNYPLTNYFTCGIPLPAKPGLSAMTTESGVEGISRQRTTTSRRNVASCVSSLSSVVYLFVVHVAVLLHAE